MNGKRARQIRRHAQALVAGTQGLGWAVDPRTVARRQRRTFDRSQWPARSTRTATTGAGEPS